MCLFTNQPSQNKRFSKKLMCKGSGEGRKSFRLVPSFLAQPGIQKPRPREAHSRCIAWGKRWILAFGEDDGDSHNE